MTQRNDEHKRNDTLQNSTNSVIRVSRTRAAHWVASPIGKVKIVVKKIISKRDSVFVHYYEQSKHNFPVQQQQQQQKEFLFATTDIQ